MSGLKKGCELCSNPARMLCDSDQASLCWDCDEKVHAANFLVAKHSRTLLCHVCQSPTPWCAAGPSLGRTVSVCHACAHRPNQDGEIYSDDDDDDDDDDEEEECSEEECSEEEEEEEDGENQVVPWSESNSCSPAPPLTAATSSCSEDENVSSSSSKRSRSNSESEDEDGSWSSPNQNSNENYSCSLGLLRPLKMRRSDGDCEGGTAAIVEKLQRFEGDASAMILSLCKFTRD